MEAIITTTITVPTATLMSTKQRKCRTSGSAMKLKLSLMSSLTPSFAPFTTTAIAAKPCRGVVQVPRMEARDLAEQMKEMAAAQKRWEAQQVESRSSLRGWGPRDLLRRLLAQSILRRIPRDQLVTIDDSFNGGED